MTCNIIVLDKLQSGSNTYALSTDQSAKLNFGPDDISGMRILPDGALSISLVAGGEIVISNFTDIADAGQFLFLADDSIVSDGGLPMLADNDNGVLIGMPEAGTTQEISFEPGLVYGFDFDRAALSTVQAKDGQLILTFLDGGVLVLANYAEAAAWTNAPRLDLSDLNDTVAILDLVTALGVLTEGLECVGDDIAALLKDMQADASNAADELAALNARLAKVQPSAGPDELTPEELVAIEPAAGGEAAPSSSGYGFNSKADEAPLESKDATGPLGVTSLAYDAPTYENKSFIRPGNAATIDSIPVICGCNKDYFVDETDFAGGPLTASGTVNVTYGSDTPGAIHPNGDIQITGSVAGAQLSSHGVPIAITHTDTQYIGKAGDVVVFTLTIDPATGEFTFIQHEPLDHADAANPDDRIDVKLGLTATDADGDSVHTALKITVADDAPGILPSRATVDETDLGPIVVNGQLNFDVGADVGGGVSATGDFSAGGSMLGGNLTHRGSTVSVSLIGDTYIGTADGKTIFTLQVLADGSYEFQLLETLDHGDPNDPNDIISLNFGVAATDYDGDSAETNITIYVKDDVPTIGDSAGAIDESQFDNTGTLTHSDTLISSFGMDIGSIVPGGSFTASAGGLPIALTSNGVAVIVTQTANGYVGMAGTTQVFSLTINPATGQYTYKQMQTLDHPNGEDHNDAIELSFSVDIESSDGDTGTGTITLDVYDDGVNARDDISSAEEDQLITGDVLANDDLSQDLNNTVQQVKYDGTTYVIPAGGSVTINTAFGTFTMKSDGTYSFQVTAEDPNGLEEFTYTLRDGDGDRDVAKLSIMVSEDGSPVAVSSHLAVDETNVTPGPMIFNGHMDVDYGRDGVGSITPNGSVTPSGSMAAGALTSQGVPVVITATPTGYIGMAGTVHVFTLTMQDNGDYSFQLFDRFDHADKTDPNDLIHLDFGVTITDADGDTANGIVRIEIYDDAPVAYDDWTSAEEGQTITGNLLQNDEMSEDRPNMVVKITLDGVDHAVPATGDVTIEGKFGTFVVNSNGQYTYTTHNDDPDGTDTFTYTLRDYDGDQDTAELYIRVTPDGTPVAVNESLEVDETNLANGPVVFSDNMNPDFGLDGVGTILPNGNVIASQSLAGGALTHHGIPVVITATATGYVGVAGIQTIFTLTIKNNGDYTFTLFDTLDHADPTAPDDVIRIDFGVNISDADGDTVPGYVKVIINDDAPVAYDDNGGTVDEGQQVSGNVMTNDLKSQDDANTISKVVFNGASHTVPASGQATIIGNFGTLKISANGTYTYTAKDGISADGQDVFTYTLRDGEGDSDTAEITFNVANDDQPIVVNAATQVDETGGLDTVSGTVSVNYGGDGPGTVAGSNTFSSSYALTSGDVPVTVTYEPATGTYTGKAGTAPIFTLKISANGTYTFTQLKQLDHADASNANDSLDLVFGVKATDADGDVGTGSLTIKVLDDGPVAVNDGATAVENKAPVTGNVLTNDNAGADTGGAVTKVVYNGATHAVPAGGSATIIASGGTLIINSNGSYTFTPKATGIAASASDVFTYTMKDFDGDTSSATLSVTTSGNDNPVVINASSTVDETGGLDTISGTVNVSYGSDTPGSVTGTGTLNSSYALKSGGVAVSVSYNAATGTYTAVAGSTTVFTLKIGANGIYTFTQLAQLDHANASDHNDGLDLVFGVKATDGDGDVGLGSITIKVLDDGPVANDDENKTWVGDTASGNLLANDVIGADKPGAVIIVNQNGKDYVVPATGSISIPGAYGTLVVKADGSYVYTSTAKVNATESFTYTLRDADGDTDPAVLGICLKCKPNSVPVITGYDQVDETGGLDTVSGTLSVNYGIDGAGSVAGTNTFSSSYPLKSGGVAVAVLFDAATGIYTGKAGAATVFTAKINPNGTYTFIQLKALDHADANPNDSLDLYFGVKATDDDGDVGTGHLTIRVFDDGPKAVNDTMTVEEGNPANGKVVAYTGNVLANDTVGADGGATVTQVVYNNVTYPVPAGGSAVIVAAGGTLYINSAGGYSFTPKTSLASDVTDLFTYTMRDFDADTSAATLSIKTVAGDDTPVIANGANQVDETGGFDTVSGTVSVNYGNDGPGKVAGSNTFSSSYALKSAGVAVVVTFDAATKTYTGKAGSATVFTLTVADNGAYTFKQLKALDHADPTNPNDRLELVFGIKATDADGDVGNGKITISVFDDAPIARNDVISGLQVSRLNKPTTITGDLIEGKITALSGVNWGNFTVGQATGTPDTIGADAGHRVTQIEYDGAVYAIAEGGSVTIRTSASGTFTKPSGWGGSTTAASSDDIYYGDITFYSNGTYVIKDAAGRMTNMYNDNGMVNFFTDTFKYTLMDRDGDTSVATLTLKDAGIRSPLVLDLDGDGIELLGLDAGTMFDMDNDGIADRTGWVAADDALLAIDLDGDGIINNQSELFGNTDTIENGFANLAQYDSNGDGRIDASDDVWDRLIVWKDGNGDGISAADEMRTLGHWGIVSIDLNAAETGYDLHGNWVTHDSNFTREDGSTGHIVDAWFEQAHDEQDALFGQANAADRFLISAIGEATTMVHDFDKAEGDVLDLSALLDGQDGISASITDFVQMREENGDTIFSVDVDGMNGLAQSIDVARLAGTTGLDLAELVDNGNIVV